MTISQKQTELNALLPGEYIFFKHSELNEWQAAKKIIGKSKQFEVTNDKIIRTVSK